MSKYHTLPLKTRLLAAMAAPSEYLAYAPDKFLKAFQQTSVSPVLGRVLFGKREDMALVEQHQVPCEVGDVSVRCYYPHLEQDLAVILFFHAGGWVIGNLETHDTLCRRIAKQTGCLVISVDYALAPWVKFPVPVIQCEIVLQWLINNAAYLHANAQKIVVMGDSAGGNLSAVLARKYRQQIRAQVLVYPVLDATLSSESVQQYSDAPILSKKIMQFFVDCYIRYAADKYDEQVSPLFSQDFSHLPPCLMITGEFDILREDGFAYVQKLKAAGNHAEHAHYPDIHGFLSLPFWCASADGAMEKIVDFIKENVKEPV
jgi:acetyl esterase